MQLGRVIGTVVATMRTEGLEGKRFLLVDPLGSDGKKEGESFVAADATDQAGVGAEIYYVASREAAVALDPWFVPVDHAIIGIVDDVQRETP